MSNEAFRPEKPAATLSLNRRDFLKTATGAAVGTQFLGLVTRSAAANQFATPKNLLIFITDQERATMWFPPTWEATNLPGLTRLKNNGLTFTRAFTAATMCTPSRTTLFTGLFPAQHHSYDTLTENKSQSAIEHQLDPTLPNLATSLEEAGYDVIYKGKWHLSKEVLTATPDVYIQDDISRYGFDDWDSPDAGEDVRPSQFGGGTADNDSRYMSDVLAFLQNRVANPSTKPFCLIVSLVNPHDVLAYPNSYNAAATCSEPSGGYTNDPWLLPTTPPIDLPPTISEHLTLNKKPTAQERVLETMALGLGPLPGPSEQRKYINFYARLIILADQHLQDVLAVFDNGGGAGAQLLNDTVIIRFSDHGEMCLCHGGLRQKSFNAYEETLRIPMVWSNPQMYPAAQTTSAMISHVDFLPTLCELTGVPNWQAKGFKGVSYASIVLNPAAPPVQDYVLFTSDDIYAGQNASTFPNGIGPPANHVMAIRTTDFKLARYYGGAPNTDQGEFYDLRPNGGDYSATYGLPLELNNLSVWAEQLPNPPSLTDEQKVARTQLMQDLAVAAQTRLLKTPPNAPAAPDDLKLEVVRYQGSNGPVVNVQITFTSRSNTVYTLQRSTDLIHWEDLPTVPCAPVSSCGMAQPAPPPAPVPGTNGPMALCTDLTSGRAFYRLKWAAQSA